MVSGSANRRRTCRAFGGYPTPMSPRLLSCLLLALCSACGRSAAKMPPTPAWDSVPLAPSLRFAEPVAAGDLVLLLIDAHTGAPLHPAEVRFDSTSRVSSADSLGRVRFRHVNPGTQHLLVRCVGYYLQRDSVMMPCGAGLALLIQMHRRPEPLGEFDEPAAHKPPNGH
jgi:hypothetical protein